MAALYSNASVALNSVAGESVDFALATVGLSPTVIIASSRTMSEYHSKFMKPHSGFISLFSRWIQVRSLDSGYMPSHGVLNQVANVGPTAELSLDKLRLLCISHRVDADREAQLDYEQLADLRILTGARVVYALTGPGVAGAVFQTNVFDYRRFQGSSHFGAPLSSVEVVLTGVSGNEANEQGQVSQPTIRHLFSSANHFLRSPYPVLLSSLARPLWKDVLAFAMITPLSSFPSPLVEHIMSV